MKDLKLSFPNTIWYTENHILKSAVIYQKLFFISLSHLNKFEAFLLGW